MNVPGHMNDLCSPVVGLLNVASLFVLMGNVENMARRDHVWCKQESQVESMVKRMGVA